MTATEFTDLMASITGRIEGRALDKTLESDLNALFPADGGPGGALVPFAQHKGYALAMVCEMLGAALTGGDTTRPATLTIASA